MDPELKARWVEALRSGKYRQCVARLWKRGASGPSFCALGVLSEVLGIRNTEHNTFIYPPDSVLGHDHVNKLIELNDGLVMPFPQIADWIEQNL